MRIKTIIDEDFTNYKKPAMFIGTISCSGKCCVESGLPLTVCQNDGWRSRSQIAIDDDILCRRYLSNPITKAIVFGGLEPFEQAEEMYSLILTMRTTFNCDDDIVIYTGYTSNEIKSEIERLANFKNIVVKYGRFRPNQKPHFDEILGVNLASDNQYAEVIS